jgi:hypothetical protein
MDLLRRRNHGSLASPANDAEEGTLDFALGNRACSCPLPGKFSHTAGMNGSSASLTDGTRA